ncbi:MAG: hypothetical protein OHK0026_15370 [Rhodocyclaceae bacterium]
MRLAATQGAPREGRGKWVSIALSAGMHVLLVAVLIYGVRWQSHPPEAVEVELVRELPAPPVAVRAAPAPAPPEARPKPEPAAKPEIALKEKAQKPRPKEKPQPKKEAAPEAPRPDLQRSLVEEQMRSETEHLALERAAREAAAQASAARERQASAARGKAIADYIERVRSKIRGNIVLPADVRGNPEAVFEVSQLPNGEVLPPVRLQRSSGHAGLDAAIERAILKSSPLPRPSSPELFSRVLELRFRPLEEAQGR